jgi:hypothetical protein
LGKKKHVKKNQNQKKKKKKILQEWKTYTF